MYEVKINLKGCNNINKLRKFINVHNIKLVLFGEYHGFLNQVGVQKKIIKNVKPDFLIYELLEDDKILNNKDAKRFLDQPDNKNFSVVSTYGQLKPIVRLARSFNLSVIGCDIKNMGVTWNWRKKKFSKEEAKKITNKRELQQVKVINEYTSKGLVFGLLGDYHLRKNSLVLSKLKGKKAIIVKPVFKWDKRFNHPKNFKSSEISYIVKIFNSSTS